jgi:hypothetical protein
MRRAKAMTAVQGTSGPKGWQLSVRKQLQIGSRIYPRGSTLPTGDLSSAVIARLLNTKCVEWRKPDGAKHPMPRKLVVAPPEPPRPTFKLIIGKNPLDTYHLTRGALVAACGNNVALADDIIMREAKDMYLTACREAGRSL